jgi:hypothetical protein
LAIALRYEELRHICTTARQTNHKNRADVMHHNSKSASSVQFQWELPLAFRPKTLLNNNEFVDWAPIFCSNLTLLLSHTYQLVFPNLHFCLSHLTLFPHLTPPFPKLTNSVSTFAIARTVKRLSGR